MTSIKTTHIVNGQIQVDHHEIETQDLIVIGHQQGLQVDVDDPKFVEINPQDTISCIQNLTQGQWEHISTGPPFRYLWDSLADPEDRDKFALPKDVEHLKLMDQGIQHLAGMVILGFETMLSGKNVFYRQPETYLHPSTQRFVVTLITNLQSMFSGKLETAVLEKYRDPRQDWEQCREWLTRLPPDRDVCQIGERKMNAASMIREIDRESALGDTFVALYAQKRDGGISDPSME